MTGKHYHNENEKGHIAADTQCWCKEYQEQWKCASYDHPDHVLFHLIINFC